MADGGVGEAALAEEVIGTTEAASTTAEAATAAETASEAAAAASAASAASAAGAGAAGTAGATGTGIASLSPEAASSLMEYNPEIAQQLAQTQAAAGQTTAFTQGASGTGGISNLATNTGWGEAAVPQELQYTAPQVSEGVQTAANSQTLPANLGQSTAPADFGNAPFEPRPGITPENYGQAFDTMGPSNAALKPEPPGMLEKAGSWVADNPGKTAMAVMGIKALTQGPNTVQGQQPYNGPLSKYHLSQNYQPYQYKSYAAGGGVIEQMSNANSIGQNTGYPTADIQQGAYATPWQTPISRNVVADSSDSGVDSFTGDPRGMAKGGIANLGGYSDGGRMLKGPGDGMSDNIPAVIGGKQPARLADGEFVVPADVVSHLGNGSTDAGAKQLYKMMDKVRAARTGTKKQGKEINPNKYMPS